MKLHRTWTSTSDIVMNTTRFIRVCHSTVTEFRMIITSQRQHITLLYHMHMIYTVSKNDTDVRHTYNFN